MTIRETTTVAEIAAALPASVRVFQRHGIDFCCGGRKPLAAVCDEHGLSFSEIAADIEASTAMRTGGDRDWSREELGVIIGHIVVTYHQPLREELPRLEAMARKVADVHAGKAPHLIRVHAIVAQLAAELAAHMRKEEIVLFPAIDALEVGALQSTNPISAPIAMMEHEHDDAGELLAELRKLTDGYEPPRWGCATMRALYHGLAELEAAMHVHVHLENNVLFPRALGMVGGVAKP